MKNNNHKKDFGLYIHIPFCVRKCHYCDFLSIPASGRMQEKYLDALIQEINLTPERNQGRVQSIYFGGGTPSLLRPAQMERIMDRIYACFSVMAEAEISMEVNPGALEKDQVKTYKKVGINRISMGLQSTKNTELKMLGRIHTYEQFKENYKLFRLAGFDNISVDLLLAIPGQDQAEMLKGLQDLMKVRPDHISVYSLILEENTKFYEIQDQLHLPSDEAERDMYWAANDYLFQHGYYPYEISNYALKGKECQHNIRYWSDGDYLGLGVGAASYWEGVRWRNVSDIQKYIRYSFPRDIREITQEKEEQKHLEEYLFLGLRKREGILVAKLNQVFDRPLEKLYAKEIEKMSREGFLEEVNGYLRLTPKGIDFSNLVFSQFLK